MARERNSIVLVLIGVLWLAIAVVWALTLLGAEARVVPLITFGLASLVAGLFFGQAIQKVRNRRAAKLSGSQ